MKHNIGTIDRATRIGVGLLLIALAATETTGAWAYIGIVLLVTGLMRFCPVYRMFNVTTCPTDPA